MTKSRMNYLSKPGRLALSFLCLFLCLTLACASSRAEALTWQDYAGEVRKREERFGDYAYWPIAEKENLIQTLVDMGHIRESSATAELFEARMSEENRHRLADQIMLRFLGGDGNVFVRKDGVLAVCWEAITRVILGDPSTWTLKERAWYQQTTNMFGRDDPDIFVLPTADDLPEKEAVAIARAAIINAYDLAEDALDGFMPGTDLYITNSRSLGVEARPDYRRWLVNFLYYQYGQEDGRTLVQSYSAIVDPNGHVIADTEMGEPHVRERALNTKTRPENGTSAIVQAFREFAKGESCYFPWKWTAEAKAEYSQQLRPQVLEALEKGDLAALSAPASEGKPIQELIDSTVFAYGLPEAEALQEDEARQLAMQALADEHGLSQQALEQYTAYASFDITAPDAPLWKFLFCPDSFEGMETVLLYKVELNANTKEALATYVLDWDRLFQEQAYDLLLY